MKSELKLMIINSWEMILDINNLKKFIVIAQCNHLSLASKKLNQTPAALSKVIKRLENQLSTRLFDRVGRNIKLNRDGNKLLVYAVKLVHEADQVVSEFTGEKHMQNINITGPSILMHHWLPQFIKAINKSHFRFQINVAWEGDALLNLNSGQADMALVTKFATDNTHYKNFKSLPLVESKFSIVAASSHAVVKACDSNGQISREELNKHAFVSPSISPFCGLNRGEHSDGWVHKEIIRRLMYRCNDFSILLNLVKSGGALAYVPDFIADEHQLVRIKLNDVNRSDASETIQLVYKPSMASGWLKHVVQDCANIATLS